MRPTPPRGVPAPRCGWCCQPLEPRVLLADALPTVFAVIGDFGTADPSSDAVAALVKSWDPQFVITTGDNNYPTGSAATIDAHVGRNYHEYIYNYRGAYGPGSPTRRFFPSLGNHDWGHPAPTPEGIRPYLDYFDLPGNERYYEFAFGPVRLFSVDSDIHEPDGTSPDSAQGRWLQERLAAATEPWKLVYFHHAPYATAGSHSHYMRWPFKGWGASAVITGHLHKYERFTVDGMPYITNGIGGAFRTVHRPDYPETLENRFDEAYGAMRVVATEQTIRFEGVAVGGAVFDALTLDRRTAPPAAPTGLSAAALMDVRVGLEWADASDGESGFRVERSADGGAVFRPVTRVDAGVTRFVDSPPAGGARYVYRVRALNGAGLSAPSAPAAVTTLGRLTFVPPAAEWKYKDDGVAPPDAWRGAGFDDATWRSGAAELGYGDGDERTVVGFGPDVNNRHVTTWFRKSFDVSARDAAGLRGLHVRLRRDDGGVVYLNGAEVFRSNMPAGPVTASTRAAAGVTWADQQLWQKADVPDGLLRPGRNVVAVEVHQFGVTRFSRDGDDLSFDLELVGSRDAAPPVPVLAAGGPAAGGASHAFTVTYRDDAPLDPATFGDGDVLVTGPDGSGLAARLESVAPSADATVMAAAYRVAAPGGAWDAADAGIYSVALRPGEVTDAAGNFARAGVVGRFGWAVPPGRIQGSLYDDRNLNRARDAGEAPLAGFVVYVDGNANGAPDPGERTATTDGAGAYLLADLPGGTHTVRVAPRDGWRAPTAVGREVTGDAYTVILDPGQTYSAGGTGLSGRSLILGHVLNDVDGSGFWNGPDLTMPGQTVYLDLNDDGELDAGEPAKSSGDFGRFAFEVEPGTYVLRWAMPRGWRPTLPMEPGQYTVTVYPGDVADFHTIAATRMAPDAGGPYAVDEGGAVPVSAAASRIPGAEVMGYEWDFDYDGVTFRPDLRSHEDPTATFRPWDDGTGGDGAARVIGVRVLDLFGRPSDAAAATVRVRNVAPSVAAGGDADVAPLEPFTLSGSFADPGPDAWAATVDWGDGSGPQPLALGPGMTFSAARAYGRAGVYTVTVTVTDDDGAAGTDTATVRVSGAAVVGRRVFYNNSAFDGRDPAADARDDAAVAGDKQALLRDPGRTPTFRHVTGYARGINGLMVDVLGLPDLPDRRLGPGDFAARAGRGGDPSGWAAVPPPAVTVRRGAGADGSDRVTLVWPDGAVVNKWLRVTVLATAATGLARPDVFYFGNLVGNAAGGSTPGQVVNGRDLLATRRALYSTAAVTSAHDFNRDGRVGLADLVIARSNYGGAIDPILWPAAPPAATDLLTSG